MYIFELFADINQQTYTGGKIQERFLLGRGSEFIIWKKHMGCLWVVVMFSFFFFFFDLSKDYKSVSVVINYGVVHASLYVCYIKTKRL